MSILESNSRGIHIIYIVDHKNGGSEGQCPEGLMKVQQRQGYCLLLIVDDTDYNAAEMEAVFYAQGMDGLWKEVIFAKGLLRDFSIGTDGQILYANEPLNDKLSRARNNFTADIEREKARRAEQEKQYEEKLKRLLAAEEYNREKRRKREEEEEQEYKRQAEEAAKRRAELQERQRLERERQQEEKRRREEDFRRNRESNFTQQETPVIDADGNRWIKCEFCGKIATEGAFSFYGGRGRINLGTCKDCLANNPATVQKVEEKPEKVHMKYEADICPECGGKLRDRSGRYGKLMGCSNYPTCRYSRRI